MKITQFELGWLVALLEGEGTFFFTGKSETINLQMCDEDIMYRYAKLCEKISGKMPTIGHLDRGASRSDVYQVTLRGKTAKEIMRIIVPHMGTRRRARIWQVLNRYKAVDNGMKSADLLELVRNNA